MIYRRLFSSYTEFYAHATLKIKVAAYIGIVTFPVYHFVWLYFSPQPYHSLPLRLFGSALCLAVIIVHHWPALFGRFQLHLTYLTTVYCLPFFFAYMTLMNGASHVWQLSSIAAVVYLIFLFDAWNILVATVIGIGCACILFYLTAGEVHWHPSMMVFFLTLMFAVISVVFLNYGERLIVKTKIAAASAMAGQVAHEIRTPLLSIRLEAERLLELLPGIVEAAIWAEQNGWQEKRLSDPNGNQIQASLERITGHVSSSNMVIEMLLTNVGQHHSLSPESNMHSMAELVDETVGKFPFKGSQRARVSLELEEDFQFSGSRQLMIHMLFNLIKNSLRAIASKGSGNTIISLKCGLNQNQLIVADTGIGIPADALPYIFVPFFTTERSNAGSGIGLAFCRDVVEAIGGTISCSSALEHGTKFVVDLPCSAATST